MTTRPTDKGSWVVPWIYQADWQEMLQFTETTCGNLGNSRVEVMRHINDIIKGYEDLEFSLSGLCNATCPTCENVCCTVATVWYDQRDILVYHLVTDSFPEKQVSRSDTGICCHLGKNGCRLPRLERPFICTWYICKAQTTMLRSRESKSDTKVQNQIQRIKETRKKMEALCQAF